MISWRAEDVSPSIGEDSSTISSHPVLIRHHDLALHKRAYLSPCPIEQSSSPTYVSRKYRSTSR